MIAGRWSFQIVEDFDDDYWTTARGLDRVIRDKGRTYRGHMTAHPFLRAAHIVDTLLDGTVVLGFTRVGLGIRRRLPGWPADPAPHALAGRRVLVTGATSGLGEATALGCLRLGAHVDLVVRNPAKGEDSRARLLAECPNGSVEIVRCDLTDLSDIRRAVGVLTQDKTPIDAIVHNAGAMPAERSESPQGHELTMALHVLGPVLMTTLLAPQLAADARVVMVTSGGMYGQKLRDDDPEFHTGEYSGLTAYARSKRAQVELLPLLQGLLGDRVHVYATHPGWADTPGVADSLPTFRKITRPFLRDVDEGADTTVWLTAVDPAPAGGQFFHDRRLRATTKWGLNKSEPGARTRMWTWVLAQLDVKSG